MVVIFVGSSRDLPLGNEIINLLQKFGIAHQMHIASAHKTPELLLSLIQKYETQKDPLVYICIAGRSNALGGFVDAQVIHPVINCPPYTDKFAGLDILSSLRMPSGVSPLTVLEPEQAALAAAKILSLSNPKLERKVVDYQKKLKDKITADNDDLTGLTQ